MKNKNNNIHNVYKDNKKKKKSIHVKQTNKNKKQDKNKEKIEKLVNRVNPNRTSLMERIPRRCNHRFNYMNPKLITRIGGKGSIRKKKICICGELVKKNVKISKKQIKISAPIHYAKDDCCVCYERVKMSKDNIIDCNGKTKTLCLDCKGKMKKDVCPLCNNHSIGLKIMNYNFNITVFMSEVRRILTTT